MHADHVERRRIDVQHDSSPEQDTIPPIDINALVLRIYELEGKLPDDMKVFQDMSACPPARSVDLSSTIEIVKALLKAEQCAVRGYTEIRNISAGKDHRTYDLALAILNEEVQHEPWFTEFLGKGPSGHFRRPAGVNSPFVSKFLQ